MIKSLFMTLFAVAILGSCSSSKTVQVEDATLQKLTVGSRQATVDGKKIYIVKKGTDHIWFYLYSGIEGFSGYEEGYEYELQTKVVPRTPTASDVSAIGYVFIKEISKVKKDSKGMPGFSMLR